MKKYLLLIDNRKVKKGKAKMFYINDIVKVTKEAKEDIYENAWWTNVNLKIDHIDKSMGEGEENTLYSFEDIEGKEVPNSLYAYELELVESSVKENIKERLNYRYELVEYNVDSNINESDEITYLEKVVDEFSLNDLMLYTIVEEDMRFFFEYSFEDKLENAKYIEDYIDEFMQSCGVNNFRGALDGGIREYLYKQFFSNSSIIYKNLIYTKLNKVLSDIDVYDEKMLSELNTLFLNFDSSTVEDIVYIKHFCLTFFNLSIIYFLANYS